MTRFIQLLCCSVLLTACAELEALDLTVQGQVQQTTNTPSVTERERTLELARQQSLTFQLNNFMRAQQTNEFANISQRTQQREEARRSRQTTDSTNPSLSRTLPMSDVVKGELAGIMEIPTNFVNELRTATDDTRSDPDKRERGGNYTTFDNNNDIEVFARNVGSFVNSNGDSSITVSGEGDPSPSRNGFYHTHSAGTLIVDGRFLDFVAFRQSSGDLNEGVTGDLGLRIVAHPDGPVTAIQYPAGYTDGGERVPNGAVRDAAFSMVTDALLERRLENFRRNTDNRFQTLEQVLEQVVDPALRPLLEAEGFATRADLFDAVDQIFIEFGNTGDFSLLDEADRLENAVRDSTAQALRDANLPEMLDDILQPGLTEAEVDAVWTAGYLEFIVAWANRNGAQVFTGSLGDTRLNRVP